MTPRMPMSIHEKTKSPGPGAYKQSLTNKHKAPTTKLGSPSKQ